MSLFTHAFPDADENERRAHHLSTLLEYEESMQAWEETKNSGELDSDSDSSEDEDELTGNELLRDLDPPAPCPPADTIPTARSGRLEWPKKVLEQTNLVSSIAAEIERNINRAEHQSSRLGRRVLRGLPEAATAGSAADGSHLG